MMAHWFSPVNEWGIPDWKEADLYGDTTAWSVDRWRWEFTRRREDYRRDFEVAIGGRSEPLDLSDPKNLPVDISPDDAWCYGGIRAWPFSHRDALKYGLVEFFDPVLSDWGCGPEWGSGLIYGPFGGVRTEFNDAGEVVEVEAPNLVSLTFDLSLPLGPQLKAAKKELEDCLIYHWYDDDNDCVKEVKNVKHHTDKWLTYIRLLDARAAGASLADMAEILPDSMGRRDQRAAGNVLKQAQEQAFRF